MQSLSLHIMQRTNNLRHIPNIGAAFTLLRHSIAITPYRDVQRQLDKRFDMIDAADAEERNPPPFCSGQFCVTMPKQRTCCRVIRSSYCTSCAALRYEVCRRRTSLTYAEDYTSQSDGHGKTPIMGTRPCRSQLQTLNADVLRLFPEESCSSG